MITKKELEKLRVSHSRLNKELHYTIGGTIEKQVHSALEAERINKLKQGEYKLQKALEKMRHEQVFSSRKGLAKAHFNHKQNQTQEV